MGSHAAPYRLPNPPEAARVLREVLGPRSADGLIALEDGGEARLAIDLGCREALGQGSPRVAVAGFRTQTGDWGSAGMLGVGLAALTLGRGELRDATGETLPVHRIALVGAARSGVIAPAILRRATSPA